MASAQSGTYHLDGLLEGPMGGLPDARAKLGDWIRIASESGYGFSLQVEGDSFNLLADTTRRKAPHANADMAEPLRSLLEQLVQSFPPPLQPQLFSTVRSVQWGEGLETQTIYQVMPDGRVEAQQRTVDAPTEQTPGSPTTGDMLKLIGMGLLVLLALFGISSIFIDWGDEASKALRKITPIDTASIATDLGAFEPYLTIETMESKANTLRVTVKRTEAFPQSVDAVDRALEENGLSYATRRALHALGSGYVRVELFDGERKHLGTASVRIAELREKDTAIIVLPVLRETPPATLQLTW